MFGQEPGEPVSVTRQRTPLVPENRKRDQQRFSHMCDAHKSQGLSFRVEDGGDDCDPVPASASASSVCAELLSIRTFGLHPANWQAASKTLRVAKLGFISSNGWWVSCRISIASPAASGNLDVQAAVDRARRQRVRRQASIGWYAGIVSDVFG